jgi:A/G-specific adenine glycosylase
VTPIAQRLLAWYGRHGRHDLPWQHPRTPYRVWLSEVMLQQTQVATVVSYFQRFVAALPDIASLARASHDDVLALWSGLGYYSRARNLQRAAQICVERHGGELPADFDALTALPGIGRSTAGAILAQAHDQPFAILDGNVKRVLARYHGVQGWPGATAVERVLWRLAESDTPLLRVADYTQAIMDLGATLCTRSRPRCVDCPLQSDCVARRDGTTSELPQRKPAKVNPVRATCMLILFDADDRVLLERRPPRGVWAGLWSVPEADTAQAAAQRARALNAPVDEFSQLDPFTHVFSHYRLQIQPLLARVHASPHVADNADLRWCSGADLDRIGLPAPVRKLLATL